MPDRVTGLPRPPSAPLPRGWKPDPRPALPGKLPPPPPGQGPILEWYRAPRRVAVVVTAIVVGGAILYMTYKDRGWGWTSTWWLHFFWLWAILPFYFGTLSDCLTAGADWVRWNKNWVKTYELTEVQVKARGAQWPIILKDLDGHRMSVSIDGIRCRAELWDLVYNGILHSMNDRIVKTNKHARNILNLPY